VKALSLVLAADVDRRTRGRLLGALSKMGERLEVLELQLESTSDEVRSSLHPLLWPLTVVVCSCLLRAGRIAGVVQASGHAVT
jgi:hypothetical protein